MSNHKTASMKWIYSVVILVIAILTTVFFTSTPASKNPDAGRTGFTPQVKNLTASLQVTKVELTPDGGMLVSLKNGYSQGITDYQVALGDTLIETAFTNGDRIMPLAPGATQEEFYPQQQGVDMKKFIVMGVVFEDGSSDGDPGFAKEIAEKREGEKFMIMNALPLLRSAINSLDNKNADAISNLKSQIRGTPDGKQARFSPNVRLGIQHKRNRILYRLERIRKFETDLARDAAKDELLELEKTLIEANQHK